MGGSGGGNTYTIRMPSAQVPSATELVDAEITTKLSEAKRVKEVLSEFLTAQHGDFILAALNAGQGDCCVMRLPDGKIVVVDCNVRSANVNLIGFLEKAGVKKIDLLILTHPDQDHVSGLPQLADAFKVTQLLDGRFRKEGSDGERTPGYEEYRQAIEKLRASGTEILNRTPMMGDELNLKYGKIEFLSPHAPMLAQDANEASLAFRVSFGERSVLFGGDVTKERWEEIVASKGSELKSDVFWCSHHGADSGCCPPAIQSIAPDLSIVSVGENSYGHPHSDAMDTLRQHSGDVRRTDDGTISIMSRKGGPWKKIT